MKLTEIEFLFIDCQTTGMRPPNGHLLELAWARAKIGAQAPIASSLVRLPEGIEIPRAVSDITGIQQQDLSLARDPSDVFNELHGDIEQMSPPRLAVIHYAQFETPFLLDLYRRFGDGQELPFRVICSHRVCKRLVPEMPNPNIRGASGYFGHHGHAGLRRAQAHVRATQDIWRGLTEILSKNGIQDLGDLESWLQEKPEKKKPVPFAYRLDKLKRLKLPDQPGVYRMISKSGQVLYVGKATSLKSRVNSYFRGQKNRNRFKMEMLAQVWDLQITPCGSPLEAALLETDEIKRHNPPYNIVLKTGRRQLLYYDHQFLHASKTPSPEFHNGPFRNSNWIEPMRLLAVSLHEDVFHQIFYEPIDPDLLRAGFALYASLNGLDIEKVRTPRSLLAFGMWRLKNQGEVRADESAPVHEEQEERELTPLEIAGKFDRLLRRAAAEHRRTRAMTRLLNSDVSILRDGKLSELRFRNGKVMTDETCSSRPTTGAVAWQSLGLEDFDRMSILLSELAKVEHRIRHI